MYRSVGYKKKTKTMNSAMTLAGYFYLQIFPSREKQNKQTKTSSSTWEKASRAHPFQEERSIPVCAFPGLFDLVCLIYVPAMSRRSWSPDLSRWSIFVKVPLRLTSCPLPGLPHSAIQAPGISRSSQSTYHTTLLASEKCSSRLPELILTIFCGSLPLPSGHKAYR